MTQWLTWSTSKIWSWPICKGEDTHIKGTYELPVIKFVLRSVHTAEQNLDKPSTRETLSLLSADSRMAVVSYMRQNVH